MADAAQPVAAPGRRQENGAPTGRPGGGSFGERLAERVAQRRSQIVLGLDPDPARLWPQALELAGGGSGDPAEAAARAVTAHCRLVLEAAAE
ncbi:MAG TPA: hypothetical protein VG371_06640, partial [Solirubrobacteraceae bacterium]|nr:hypothetical protein [Solirubrobacteraceae bacterium]